MLVEQQDQSGPLMVGVGSAALPQDLLAKLHEIGRKDGLMERRGAWHRENPVASCVGKAIRDAPLTVDAVEQMATLQLILKWDH